MRQLFEEKELQNLSPLAIKSSQSKGRSFKEEESNNRTCFQRDCDRVIHCKAFRRLKNKTQVFIAHESDHYRSRLTHSIEVAHISRHMARLLSLNEDLCETIALAHDLGHTPFGHSGEQELNRLMKNFGGFEHNRQSRRVVDELENKYPDFKGLNLTFEVKEGLIKHSSPWDKPEEKTTFVSLEAQVVNLADEIAYNNHDLDDGLSSGLLKEKDLEKEVELWREAKLAVTKKHKKLTKDQLQQQINSYLISTEICDVVENTEKNIKNLKIHTIADLQKTTQQVVDFSPQIRIKNTELRKFLFKRFYSNKKIIKKMKEGQKIIRTLFKAYNKNINLLEKKYRIMIKEKPKQKERIICDYIAGMTDSFAINEISSIEKFGATA